MTVRIHALGDIKESDLKYVVTCVRYRNQWLFVRHKERETWEMPGGHIEQAESSYEAAVRELYEEAGIRDTGLEPVCDYCVQHDAGTGAYARLFYCHAEKLGKLPEYEMAERGLFDSLPSDTTYRYIYTVLFDRILLFENTVRSRNA